MPDFTYSVFGLIAIFIHCTINKNTIFHFNKKESDMVEITHRKFLVTVLLYFITDALWGIFDVLNWTEVLYADTVIYYLMMSFAVVLWAEYTVLYLEQENIYGKILPWVGRAFLLTEMIALVVNFFHPFFFWFDENGTYHAGVVRYVLLYVQIALFAVSALQTLIVAIRNKGVKRRRNYTIFLLGIAMIIAIVLQIDFPLLPIYTVGYLLGCCVLHTYVEEDEIDEHFETLKHNLDIISFMANVYNCSYYVNMKTGKYYELDNKIAHNSNIVGQKGDATETLNNMCEHLVLSQYKKEMLEFTDMTTLDERLVGKRYVSAEFESVNLGWAEGSFIAGNRDENGKLLNVIWAIRTINDMKEKEAQLLYNSYVDELTGIYNRKMLAEDINENIKTLNDDDFVYISMDVNGLKGVNDTLGHAAGDELIRGAAQVMKACMKDYGKVYRMGGDEFTALLNISAEDFEAVKKRFKEMTENYDGKYIDKISVSWGYVFRNENPSLSLFEIEKLADKRMYEAKHEHYRTNGVDRRSQQNAYKRLCELYTKILKVNLTKDEYSIIAMPDDERTEEKGFDAKFYEWIRKFAITGHVHEDDQERFLQRTSREYMTQFFLDNHMQCLNITYHRKYEDGYKLVAMDIVPAEDYKADDQNVYLYIKTIEK